MTRDFQIRSIRREIFRLAKLSPNASVMHWYMWLDDCFENDEFHIDEFGSVKWRCGVLQDKEGDKINDLLATITVFLQGEGMVKVV